MITLQGLLNADTGRLRAVAEQWERLAVTIDVAVEDLALRTSDLPDHWFAGEAAQAAQERSRALQARVGNAHGYCVAIAAAVRDYAGDLEQYRRMLDEVIVEARGRGLRIDLGSGVITAPLDLADGGDPARAQAGIDAYVSQISEIVAAANEADRRATAVLDANRFREEFLPPADEPQYDDVAVLALASWTPSSRAEWWLAQHPLVQERAIAEHPEIIGSAAGLPTRDRDAANRLLLSRAKEALLAARAQDEERHGGAGSRARGEVDARLADIAELESRLPGWELQDYRPGAERDAVLTSPAGKPAPATS